MKMPFQVSVMCLAPMFLAIKLFVGKLFSEYGLIVSCAFYGRGHNGWEHLSSHDQKEERDAQVVDAL